MYTYTYIYIYICTDPFRECKQVHNSITCKLFKTFGKPSLELRTLRIVGGFAIEELPGNKFILSRYNIYMYIYIYTMYICTHTHPKYPYSPTPNFDSTINKSEHRLSVFTLSRKPSATVKLRPEATLRQTPPAPQNS